MKKLLCFTLALLMLLTLAACGSTSPQAPAGEETQTTAGETTLATDPGPKEYAFQAETSLAENSTTVTFDTPQEYETAIHDLGYPEFRGDFWRATMESECAFHPTGLTYNDETFRLVFDYDAYDDMTGEFSVQSGWILYGTKNAPNNVNMSNYSAEDFDEADVFDWNKEIPEFANDYVNRVEYNFYNIDSSGYPDALRISYSYHYENLNLYNLVYQFNDLENELPNAPRVLCQSQEEMESTGYEYAPASDFMFMDIPEGVTMGLMWMDYDDQVLEYHYEWGMTMIDWCNSKYNTEGWTVLDDATILSSDGTHCVRKANMDINDLIILDQVNLHIIAEVYEP